MRIRRLVVGELETNCYVVADDEGDAVIIDPGGDAQRIMRWVEEEALTPTCILCTHGHPDHIFAAGLLQETFNVDLRVHQLDTALVARGVGEMEFLFDMQAFRKPILGNPISDGEIVPVGDTGLTVIQTPGHTPGSVCLLCGQDLFSGDTLFAGGVGRTDLAGGSETALLKSIQAKLLVMDDEVSVHPGHGPETTIGDEKRSNPWLRKG